MQEEHGRPIKIITNYFQLSSSPANTVFLYFCDFHPEVEADNRLLRMRIIGGFRRELSVKLGNFLVSGGHLISLFSLEEPFTVGEEGEEYTLNIRHVGHLTPEHPQAYRMYLNITLKKMLQALKLRQLTRYPKYFDASQIERIPDYQLSVWRGYEASFSHHFRGYLLNIDTASKIIREETALGKLAELRSQRRGDPRQTILEYFVGRVVMTTYGNNKCYKIHDVSFEETPKSTFQRKFETVSYIEYFESQYKIKILDLAQPLLVVQTERDNTEIKLIPELCLLTGLDDHMRNDYRVMSAVAEKTRMSPRTRLEVTQRLATKLMSDPEVASIRNTYNVLIDPQPLTVAGVQLKQPSVYLGGNKRVNITDNGDFNISNNYFVESVHLDHWAIFSTKQDRQVRETLAKTMKQRAEAFRITLRRPEEVTYERDDLISKFKRLETRPQIAVFILPAPLKRLYPAIKHEACTSLGVPTQCVVTHNLTKPNKYNSLVTKLMVQIAAKTGSVPWKLPRVPEIPTKTMIIGIDVHHDVQNRADSVIGFVASVHPDFTKYFNTVRIQPRKGQEIILSLQECVKEALGVFFTQTGKLFLPEMIIVYRDGVGDSQLEVVKEFEVAAIRAAAAEFGEYTPSLVYVVVNKKTSCRLYHEDRGHVGNPPRGTFVVGEITPDNDSFYLISHSVGQGQATPTLYRTIHKEGGISLQSIAKLSMNLCYLYFNWSGAVKVPAPIMLANKLAFVVGQNVHGDYKQSLKLSYWYL